jgi:hypothetical protein
MQRPPISGSLLTKYLQPTEQLDAIWHYKYTSSLSLVYISIKHRRFQLRRSRNISSWYFELGEVMAGTWKLTMLAA